MEVISYDETRLTSLFVAPRKDGQLFLPPVVDALVKRYKFIEFPRTVEDFSKDTLHFGGGSFEDYGIGSFDIYYDGVIITSKVNTRVLERFLDDVVEWMATFGLRRVETNTVNKAFESRLVVKAHPRILKWMDVLQPIQELLSSSLEDATGIKAAFRPVGLAMSPDNMLLPGMRPVAFRVERRPNTEFATDFYVTAAPLRTDDHVKVLKKLESLVR